MLYKSNSNLILGKCIEINGTMLYMNKLLREYTELQLYIYTILNDWIHRQDEIFAQVAWYIWVGAADCAPPHNHMLFSNRAVEVQLSSKRFASPFNLTICTARCLWTYHHEHHIREWTNVEHIILDSLFC